LLESKKCQTCGLEMQFAGENFFRTGGVSGAWQFVLAWAKYTEDTIPLVTYICPKCGRVEFYANEKIRQKLVEVQSQNIPESEFGRALKEEGKRKG
jgi:ribosomal protein S27AE